MDERRKFLAISIKHTEYKWKFGMPCVLWGSRTVGDMRCFGGYTMYPEQAELYALGDFEEHYGSGIIKSEPVQICVNLCKKYKNYDTVLIPYDEYISYCNLCGIKTRKDTTE